MPNAPKNILDQFYDTAAWRQAREAVKQRDANRCTVARLLGGACGGDLHVHHIEALGDRPDLALDADNLATVCATHHPTWERLRRELTGEAKIPACRHRSHPYWTGALACLNQRRAQVGLDPISDDEYKERRGLIAA